MEFMTLGSAKPEPDTMVQHIYCPSLQGLSARLADASFLMPRMDQNRSVKEAKGHGHWAGAIAADPFGSNSVYFNALIEAGYSGVVNWPSSILLEGRTQQQMSTIPASPAAEYAYLQKAHAFGLKTLGFILTPDHAAMALSAGIKNLVLHPGILFDVDDAGAKMMRRALETIIRSVKTRDKTASVYLYTSHWHDQTVGLSELVCDGFVRFVGDAL